MYRDGHSGFNALLYAPFLPVVSSIWSLELALVGALVAVGVANLPDLDEPLPWLQHRGPTHTVWFAVLVGLIAGVGTALAVPSSPDAFAFGLVVGTGGILAHLAGDIVTPMGISPFAPSGEPTSRSTGSNQERPDQSRVPARRFGRPVRVTASHGVAADSGGSDGVTDHTGPAVTAAVNRVSGSRLQRIDGSSSAPHARMPIDAAQSTTVAAGL